VLQHFVNRETEIEFLERKYAEDAPGMIVIYGKRRVGKTELIKKFSQNKKSLYFLCTKDSIEENIKELKLKFSELAGKEYFLQIETTSFLDIFKYLAQEIRERKVEPLQFKDTKEFFKNYTIEELVKMWAICGGTPFYLSKMNPDLTVEGKMMWMLIKYIMNSDTI